MGFVMKGFPMLGYRNTNGKIEGWEQGIMDKIEANSPAAFKGADHTNSKCWPGCKKVGTKISGRTGRKVNDCDCGGKYSKK